MIFPLDVPWVSLKLKLDISLKCYDVYVESIIQSQRLCVLWMVDHIKSKYSRCPVHHFKDLKLSQVLRSLGRKQMARQAGIGGVVLFLKLVGETVRDRQYKWQRNKEVWRNAWELCVFRSNTNKSKQTNGLFTCKSCEYMLFCTIFIFSKSKLHLLMNLKVLISI